MKLDDILKEVEPKMDQAVDFVKDELGRIRAGQASGSLVEDLKVDYYGAQTPLQELANVTTPNPQTIVIQPYDDQAKEQIVLAIQNSDLNLTPSDNGQRIILNLPPLSQERREELIRKAKDKAEEARISIRNVREEAWDKIQEMEQSGDLTEDDKYRGKDSLDEMVDERQKEIKKLVEEKQEKIRNI